MRGSRFASMAAFALLATVASGRFASAQTPQAGYYGYTSQQAPTASPQGGVPCQSCHTCHGCAPIPPPDCQPDKCGCNVVDHRVPCQTTPITLPGFETCQPACQNAILIESECAPDKPATYVTVWRNHYVPIKIVNRPAEHQVQPVNIVVKSRIVHYLCDCPPGTTECPHGPPPTPQKNPVAVPQANANGASPAPDAQLTSTAPAAAPAAPEQPAKKWVYLTYEKVWGFGYQRADGYWVIDEGSRRATPPAAAPAPTTTAGTPEAPRPTGA
jgi:hypothetical protein